MQTAQWAVVLLNSLVAGLLLFASFMKLASPALLGRSLLLLTGRESLSAATVVRAIGLVEFIVAIGLMAPGPRLAAAGAGGVLGAAFAVSGAAARGLRINEPCGCFGVASKQPLGLVNIAYGTLIVADAVVNFAVRPALVFQYTVRMPVFSAIALCVICLAFVPRAVRETIRETS